MRTNLRAHNLSVTHEGGPAVPRLRPLEHLRRSVLACLLWEDQFYEDGQSIAQRIEAAAAQVTISQLAAVAIEARNVHNLRHVPLLLLCTLVRRGSGTQHSALVRDTIALCVRRGDEMAELLALYWGDKANRHSLPKQMRRGLAMALAAFDEYQLAKYDRDQAVKLRDVLRLVRPRPTSDQQRELWGRAVRRELAVPDTWEVELSRGADKKDVFTRLLQEGKLGYLALLRNLRNTERAEVDPMLVEAAILARRGAQRVLPFRYIAAARAAPRFEPALDQALQASIAAMEQLPGRTVVLVDVSDSMNSRLSKKSDLTRMDAAAALAAVVPAAQLRVFTFSNALVEVPPRRGMAGVDAVVRSQLHGGTYLGAALELLHGRQPAQLPAVGRARPPGQPLTADDRLIVVTDEQTADHVADPLPRRAYMINVASAKNGIGYGRWTHIDGFSEGVLRYIAEVECQSKERTAQ
jgi:60 kDa SS-A/Ro ribonucleoprotein